MPPKRKDYTGQKINKLIAIEFSHIEKNNAYWKFRCDCGNIVIKKSNNVFTGRNKSCGCTRDREKYIGKRFGKLIVESFSHVNDKGRTFVKCKCDCGNETITNASSLIRVVSCGCSKIKHGMSKTLTYKSYNSMRRRVLNSKDIGYKRYGGRGITICERWLESFENFLEDMGERPEGTTIDRIENDGNYEPSNCKWSTPKEQANNRSTSKKNKKTSKD